MAKERFEPAKDGEYIVAYAHNGKSLIYEKVKFSKNKWVGSMSDDFYKKEIFEWETADGSRIE